MASADLSIARSSSMRLICIHLMPEAFICLDLFAPHSLQRSVSSPETLSKLGVFAGCTVCCSGQT